MPARSTYVPATVRRSQDITRGRASTVVRLVAANTAYRPKAARVSGDGGDRMRHDASVHPSAAVPRPGAGDRPAPMEETRTRAGRRGHDHDHGGQQDAPPIGAPVSAGRSVEVSRPRPVAPATRPQVTVRPPGSDHCVGWRDEHRPVHAGRAVRPLRAAPGTESRRAAGARTRAGPGPHPGPSHLGEPVRLGDVDRLAGLLAPRGPAAAGPPGARLRCRGGRRVARTRGVGLRPR